LRIFGCPVSIAVPKEKRKKWDSRSQISYMVGYEPYSSGYLVWYPDGNRIHKAWDVIFHEDVVAPATPTLYGDDNPSIDAKSHHNQSNDHVTIPAMQTSPPKARLTICIPLHPVPTTYDDQGELTPRGPTLQEDGSKLVSDIPDFPLGTTHSGRQ
jgi:hypothetical protein